MRDPLRRYRIAVALLAAALVALVVAEVRIADEGDGVAHWPSDVHGVARCGAVMGDVWRAGPAEVITALPGECAACAAIVRGGRAWCGLLAGDKLTPDQ